MAVVRSVGGAILGLSKRAALTTALVARYGGRGRREVRGALRHDERERQVPEARGQRPDVLSCPAQRLRSTADSDIDSEADVGRGLLLSRLRLQRARSATCPARGRRLHRFAAVPDPRWSARPREVTNSQIL
jgi:hypothetical protein